MMSGNMTPPVPASHAIAAPSAPPVENGIPSGLPSSAPSLTAPPVQPNRAQAQLNTIGAQPNQKDYQPIITHPLLRRIGVGLAAFGMGPQAGQEAYNNAFVNPVKHAQQAYENDTQAYNERLKNMNEQTAQDREDRLNEANINHLNAETAGLAGGKQGLTPEETTIHDLMTGDNGKPRINPDTNKPYDYLGAFSAVKQAGQDAKPVKAAPPHVTYDAGIPVSVTDGKGNVYDVNDPKLPAELKPLADAANRAHGQHVTEDAQKQANAAVLAQPNKNDARSDKSFQYSSGLLEKARTPVEQRLDKINTAIDNLNQKSPQADALAAPELLTAMVGGQGSGLRMNDAEISRLIGGATKWTELKTALNKWSLDPTHATFTDEQRGQMNTILQAGKAKLVAKQKIIEDAEGNLLNADDPKEHRKIIQDARKKLDDIDRGGASGSGKLSIDEARDYLQRAGGDKDKARQMAKADNRTF
jgi:hypothetical protein